jgi:hypothetical protein
VADEVDLSPAAGIRVSWDRAAVAALGRNPGAEPGWRLESPLPERYDALRIVSGATADGALLLLCGALPAGAAHHDQEAIAALVVDADGEAKPIEEALVSTEYAADGSVRRLGFELYQAGHDYPVRAAADSRDTPGGNGAGRPDVTRMDFRLDGGSGAAVHELVRRS